VPVENLRAFSGSFTSRTMSFSWSRASSMRPKRWGYCKAFRAIPRPERKLDNTWTEEPAQDGERLVSLRRVGDVGAIGVAYHYPPVPHEDMAALQVLANILSTQPSGRLYQALVETRKVASASAFARGEHDPGLLTIQAEVTRDTSLEEVREPHYHDCRADRRDGRHGRGSQPGETARFSNSANRPRPTRAGSPLTERMGGAGRLAALLPPPRPYRKCHARGSASCRRKLSPAQ